MIFHQGMSDADPVERLAFETARLELARLRVEPTERTAAIERALRLCAHTLGVERVGFWVFSPAGDNLVCERSYTRSTDDVGGGDVLRGAHFPIYWQALHAHRIIAAADARQHPITGELTATYLEPLGITSMLDAPVYQAGVLVGVVCHEHVGPARTWTVAEVNFASAVADLLAMVLEQDDRLRAQELLRQRLSRMVGGNQLGALEQLARSVAHDFANVVLAVELVASQLAKPGRQRQVGDDLELAKSLKACAEMGGSLVGQLRRFGARAAKPRRLPVTEVLDRLAPIVRTLTREVADLQVTTDLPPEVEAAVAVDELEQVVLNLCLNARDAIAEQGTIAVRARAAADQVVLEVEDDGCGMAAEVVTRIWEPYFTSKPRGTGIGLATV